MNCTLPLSFFMDKSPRLPASRADQDWLHPRDAGPGIPSQLATVTSRASSAAQGGGEGAAEQRRWEGRRGEFPGKHCSRWPTGLSHSDTSAARLVGGYFWKISALSGPASSDTLSLSTFLFLLKFIYFWKGGFYCYCKHLNPPIHEPMFDPSGPSLLLFDCLFVLHFTLLSASYILQAVKVACGIQGQMLLR